MTFCAAKICVPLLNTARENLQRNLHTVPQHGRIRYHQKAQLALESILESALKFVCLENGRGPTKTNELDIFIDQARSIPLHEYSGFEDCPLALLLQGRSSCYEMLVSILGFVCVLTHENYEFLSSKADIWVGEEMELETIEHESSAYNEISVGSNPSLGYPQKWAFPDTIFSNEEWSSLKMSLRAEMVADEQNKVWGQVQQDLQKCRQWFLSHRSLETIARNCWKLTLSLISFDEEERETLGEAEWCSPRVDIKITMISFQLRNGTLWGKSVLCTFQYSRKTSKSICL